MSIANHLSIPYTYKSIPVPGGGFVTGFVFHPLVKDILYCRTDIGGCYRYDFTARSWVSLIDHATDPGVWETYPLAIALDRNNPDFVYTMVGLSPVHKIGFSANRGQSWTYFDAPAIDEDGHTTDFHGNAPGRATGERLVVDPFNPDILYMGTPHHGLWKTTNRCRTWQHLDFGLAGKPSETGISLVEISPLHGSAETGAFRVVVACNGKSSSPDGNIRGQSLYYSKDGGKSFEPLVGEPTPVLGGAADHPGYVGQRACFQGDELYVSYASWNVGWSSWDSFGCDLGLASDGALFRFGFAADGTLTEARDITPPRLHAAVPGQELPPGYRLGHGISGLSACPAKPGTLVCSTVTARPDVIWRSLDGGTTWKAIMAGLEIGKIDFTVPYQKPEHNGNASLIHWMSDLKINPFDPDMAVFNTGAGIFSTHTLSRADQGGTVDWECFSTGVEETVHLNVYSPPAGEARVIDIIGDYGAFVFTDLDKPAPNTIADHRKNRWITGMNADFPDSNPDFIAIAPRGNWTRTTSGGLVVSQDQGRSWEQLPSPRGLGDDLDKLVDYIADTANVTAGWTAVSADGRTIVWGLGLPLYSRYQVCSHNLGKTWKRCRIVDMAGKDLGGEDFPFKVMADRTDPELFYGLGDNSKGGGFFVSTDRGESFHQLEAPTGFPARNLAGIDSEQHYEIRPEPGKTGIIYFAMLAEGLWKVTYDKEARRLVGERVSHTGDFIKRIGFGKEAPGSRMKTFFTSGTIGGVYGFYRSLDEGRTWTRINDDQHQYGDIRSISGDPRSFGRIYVATGTRGLVYGDPDSQS